MSDQSKTNEGNTDIAALSAAVVASTLSVLVTQGPFEPLSALVALSLMVVVFAYVWKHPRSAARSLAVAVVVGVITIPLVGFIAEMCLAIKPLYLLRYAQPLNCSGQVVDEKYWFGCAGDKEGSRVDFIWLIFSWYSVSFIVFVADRFNQKRIAPS